ncbi:SprT family protein [Pullulanibacillus sp. KACC 23026]|uniref:SprT family protein n=1 Tax=Pullulanibacillus sp. KACC 23026 TaxID=3028315 RepID=UPI0023AFAD7F|nr:SprT family protein [Pullulanibacillus sp. KACC 23026]WEG12517.1 SprT family protein [Pullulanibacillus sp. KACC 23026]
MQQKDLQVLVETVSKQSFNKPFLHQATFNSRLRTTGGRYLLRTHNLEFNPKQLELFGMEEFIKIVKHELCHYHLHIEGRGYKHQDIEFKTLLKQVGGSRYCQSVPGSRRQSKWIYLYTCKSCAQPYPRKRQMDVKRYRCGKCGGRLKLQSKLRREEADQSS